MEDLVPPSLVLVRDLRYALEDGRSLKQGLESFLSRNLECDFRRDLIRIWSGSGRGVCPGQEMRFPAHIDLLLGLILRGLAGDSIGSSLARVEEEIYRMAQDELQKRVDLLPFELMVPTLLFFFPAVMCVLVGPVLFEVVDVLERGM